MDFSIQQATQRPKIVSTGEYAQMRNQALLNDGGTPLYSLYEIAGLQMELCRTRLV